MEFKKLIIAELDNIITPNDKDRNDISRLERNLLMFDLPKVWNINTPNNMELEMEVEFEKFLLSATKETNEKIEDISTFRFYALVALQKERNARDKKISQ